MGLMSFPKPLALSQQPLNGETGRASANAKAYLPSSEPTRVRIRSCIPQREAASPLWTHDTASGRANRSRSREVLEKRSTDKDCAATLTCTKRSESGIPPDFSCFMYEAPGHWCQMF